MANSVYPDMTAPIGAVCSRSMLFASIHNLSVMLGNYLQQTTSADSIFRQMHFFLGALRVSTLFHSSSSFFHFHPFKQLKVNKSMVKVEKKCNFIGDERSEVKLLSEILSCFA